MRRLTGLRSAAGLPRLAGLAALAGAALLTGACTPGPATSAGSGGPSASAAVTQATSARPPGQGSSAGKGTGATAGAPWAARWGSAFEPPGLNGLNAGVQAQVLSVSCPSAGNCAAGGFYADASVAAQAFVVTEAAGHWGTAVQVPGLKQRNTGGKAQVSAVSCASAGNCAVTGYFTDFASGLAVPFTADERDGTWRPASPVPGIAALARNGDARATAISCPAAGDCALGGFYASVTGGTPSFVASERGGIWGAAQAVSGTTAYPGTGQQLGLAAISCAAPGDCAAAGTYTADAAGTSQGFVVTAAGGRWGKARQVPGGHASSAVTALSCPARGSCMAGGTVASGPVTDGFVMAETRGEWGRPLILPSTGTVTAVSCAAPGDCAAGGATGSGTGFVVTQARGKWHRPQVIRLANAQVSDISCQAQPRGAIGCAAVGSYLRGGSAGKAGFAVSESGGTWGTPVPVKAQAGLAAPGVPLTAVSCAAGRCSAGGYYLEAGMGTEALLVQG